jgi:hypothetical protein
MSADTAAPNEQVFAYCSFCASPNTEVTKLIAGPGVYICAGCVGLCTSILDDLSSGAAIDEPQPPRLPEWRDLTDEEMLGHVPRIATTAGRVEASLRDWVMELRRRGVTWARIGGVLGMTRQSAWERFSGEE